MLGRPLLTDGVVSLRDVTAGDLERLFDWRNDPRTRPMFRHDAPLDFEAHGRFVRAYLENPPRGAWLIVEAAGSAVGAISLYNFSPDGRACEFGRFLIAPAHRGAGYGRRALTLLLAWAASLGVAKVSCEVLSSNAQALRLYRSLGFTVTGQADSGARSFVMLEARLSAA